MLDSHLLAGVSAGLLTAAALHPLDVLKVKFQVQDGLVHAVRYTSLRSAVADVWAGEGARGFYRGLAPAMWGSGAAWGLYFYFYEACKRRLAGGGEQPAGRLTPLQLAYAAWEGGTITSLITNPIWLVKTRMQLQGGAAGAGAGAPAPYRSMAHAFTSILRADGPAGLYRGIVPALLLTSHGVVQFVAYEQLKRAEGVGGGAGGGAAALFGAGMLSKAAATLLTYPYQVTKSRLQQRFEGAPAYTGFVDVVRKMWAREGVAGFYKGFAANLLRVAPQSAITLVSYEGFLRLLEERRAAAPRA